MLGDMFLMRFGSISCARGTFFFCSDEGCAGCVDQALLNKLSWPWKWIVCGKAAVLVGLHTISGLDEGTVGDQSI